VTHDGICGRRFRYLPPKKERPRRWTVMENLHDLVAWLSGTFFDDVWVEVEVS